MLKDGQADMDMKQLMMYSAFMGMGGNQEAANPMLFMLPMLMNNKKEKEE